MNNSFTNRTVSSKTAVTAEAGGEFILPNDVPDAKRIVHARTECIRKDRMQDRTGITEEAEAVFSVIYCGDDNCLHSVKYTSPFTARSELREPDGGCVTVSEFGNPDTSVRLANPRKISIRCRVPVSFTVYGSEEVSPYIDGVQDSGLQYLQRECGTYRTDVLKENAIPLSEDVHIPENMPEPESITDVCVTEKQCSVSKSDGTADITSELDVMVIYKAQDNSEHSYKTTLSPAHRLSAEHIKPYSLCRADIAVNNVDFELTTDRTGEMRVIELDISYDAELLTETEERGVCITDMYSTENCSEVTYKTTVLRQRYPDIKTHYTVSGETSVSNQGRVIAATAECGPAMLELTENGAICTGNVTVHCIKTITDGYEGVSFDVPYKLSVKADIPQNAELKPTVTTPLPTVRSDTDKLYADVEVYVTVDVTSVEEIITAAVIRISDDALPGKKAPIVMYRPDKDETVWDVAKKYKVPQSALAVSGEDGERVILIS